MTRQPFVQQHFDVRLVLQTFGFGLLLRERNLVVAQTDRDLARSGCQNGLCFPVDRGTVPVEVRGESLFRFSCFTVFFIASPLVYAAGFAVRVEKLLPAV